MLNPITEGRYISIKSDGKFHEKVEEGTEGAVLRKYELRDGTKGEKWELLYKSIEGKITDIKFEMGDYGENLLITFTDGENQVVLAQGTNTNFGEDILKKLPALDLSEKVYFQPYAFEDEKGKERRGVSIFQKGDKVLNFFWDGEKNVNGYPEPEGDKSTFTSDDWKVFYIQARKFLTNYTKENVLPKLNLDVEPVKIEHPEEELKAEDIPF